MIKKYYEGTTAGADENEKAAVNKIFTAAFHITGGADGTRTRDPRRDRPVF